MRIRCGAWVAVLLAACGSPSPSVLLPAPDPVATLELIHGDGSWAVEPVEDNLDTVSNNGLGYTGEIDLYEVTTPAAGRLQVSLSWEQAADYDLILAADREAIVRLAEGLTGNTLPEYVGIDVASGQTVYVIVAGWEGTPGDYLLEMTLLPPGTPPFALLEPPDLSVPLPRNEPLVFTFNADLDPAQDVAARLAFLTPGYSAEGVWCIDGSRLTFHPRLPEQPGDSGGLHGDTRYTLQFARAADGVRSAGGEYLHDVTTLEMEIGGFVDPTPDEPPRVADVDHSTLEPWPGDAITITVLEPLDPDTTVVLLTQVGPGGQETPLPVRYTLRQQQICIGAQRARLVVEPGAPLPPAAVVRITLPGTVRGLTGDPGPQNLLNGGQGFRVDFATP